MDSLSKWSPKDSCHSFKGYTVFWAGKWLLISYWRSATCMFANCCCRPASRRVPS